MGARGRVIDNLSLAAAWHRNRAHSAQLSFRKTSEIGTADRIGDATLFHASCLKSRIDSRLTIQRPTTRVVIGFSSADKRLQLPEITQPSCLKSRIVGCELPEITNQSPGPAPNHVGGTSTATTFSVTPNNGIGLSALQTSSRVFYVILGRKSEIRDFRQLGQIS